MSDDTWVCCDSCGKWRRVPQVVAAELNDDIPWFCKDNQDTGYNNCDIPQELTDTEIDARTTAPGEPSLLEADEGGDESGGRKTTKQGQGQGQGVTKVRKRPPVWQLVSKNIYTHRQRKQQDEDDIMICQCKPIWATDACQVGCGDSCLNRMLNIECVTKYCPCGEKCSNQAFSKRQYAKLEVKRAGAKGFGLFTMQDLSAGQFVIEYVGEVLEEDEYARRKEFYMASGQRHYYFMNVGNGEVIDAARKGGLGRFINHSCQPNCETQKWVVRGELAIGLFTLEDIPAGTELTFDYNFERYGDKPMKCLCGATACRGVIGGTQETILRLADASIIEPEDEEELEPIMVTEKDADETVDAILDRAVGLGWEKGFDSRLQTRLKSLAAQRGVKLPDLHVGGNEGDDERGDIEDEDYDEDRNMVAAAIEAQAYVAGKRQKEVAGRKKLKGRPLRKGRHADPDWTHTESWSHDSVHAEGKASEEGDDGSSIYGDNEVAGRKVGLSKYQSHNQHPSKSYKTPKRSQSASNILHAGTSRMPMRRSEVDRRLDGLVGPSGRLRDTSPGAMVKMLRLFNLCDIGPVHSTGQSNKYEKPSENGSNPNKGGNREEATAVETLTARQRARSADLSLLLDVILKSSQLSARTNFVKYGLLQQLLGCVGRAVGEQYTVILRKVLRVVAALPFSSSDVLHTRSAHGSFLDFLRALTRHSDYEVRNAAWSLLKKWAPLNPVGSGSSGMLASDQHSLLSSPQPSSWRREREISGASTKNTPANGLQSHSPIVDGPSPRPGSGTLERANVDTVDHLSRQTPNKRPSRFGGGRYGGSIAPLAPSHSQGTPLAGAHQPYSDNSYHPSYQELSYSNTKHAESDFSARDKGMSNRYPHPAYASEDRSKRRRGGSPYGRWGHQDGNHSYDGGGERADKEMGELESKLKTIAAPVLSPVTDDEEHVALPSDQNTNHADEAVGQRQEMDDKSDKGKETKEEKALSDSLASGPGLGKQSGVWDKPNASFEEFVADVVRRRLKKYEQPDHPLRLSREDAAYLFRQIRKEIVAKEQEAFDERQKTGAYKPIEKDKVESRIKDFVRDRVRKFFTSKGAVL